MAIRASVDFVERIVKILGKRVIVEKWEALIRSHPVGSTRVWIVSQQYPHMSHPGMAAWRRPWRRRRTSCSLERESDVFRVTRLSSGQEITSIINAHLIMLPLSQRFVTRIRLIEPVFDAVTGPFSVRHPIDVKRDCRHLAVPKIRAST